MFDRTLDPMSFRYGIVVCAVLLVIFLLSVHRDAPRWWRQCAWGLPAAALLVLGVTARLAWPIAAPEISLLRAAAAAVAAVAVARATLSPERFAAHSKATTATLAICALLAVACFFNLFQPQFRNHERNEASAVHLFDMRVYYPSAKYFAELRYDGIYVASVAAYVEDDPQVSLDTLATTRLRDLTTHKKATVASLRPQIAAIKQRFSPVRWEAFKQDMRYFRRMLGSHDYLGTMLDHGANATPVWLATTRLLFMKTEASSATLLATALLDPLLLLAMFVAIAYAFGLRAMLVVAVVFGATDFYMFDTNWAGSTLRHDWMAFLGIGICALRLEKWRLAGAFLVAAAAMRAFPAVAFIGLGIPVFWWAWDYRKRHGNLPTLSMFREEQRPILQVALGGAVCLALLFAFSCVVLPIEAWSAWLNKVLLLSGTGHANHVGLRALLYSFGPLHDHLPQAKLPVLIVVATMAFALIAQASRDKRPEQAAVLGLLLIPVLFYPANYYIHFICLVPLLAIPTLLAEDPDAVAAQPKLDQGVKTWLVVLGICVAQYWTTGLSVGKRFKAASAILIFAFTAIAIAIQSDSDPEPNSLPEPEEE